MPDAPLPTPVRRNIELVARLEQALHARRTPAERAADRVTAFFGSFWFVAAQLPAVGGWMLLGSGAVPGVPAFDPYPFPFLGLVVGVEFLFLTTFVLMNQRTLARRQEQWADLTLQASLLDERETTAVLRVLHAVAGKLGVDVPADEVRELTRETSVDELVREVEKARDDPAGG